MVGSADGGSARIGIPIPVWNISTNGTHTTFNSSLYRFLIGSFTPGYDKLCIFVKCPQCRRKICLSTKNSTILDLRRLGQKFVDRVCTISLVFGGISTACFSLVASSIFALGAAGQDIVNVLARPSVQLGIYGVKRFPSLSIADALDKQLITNQKYVSVTCFLPFYLMYLGTSWAYGFQTDFTFFILAYSMFTDPDDVTDTVECGILRKLVWTKIVARALYNVTLNKVYYRWHKRVQPCFFADRLSVGDIEQIESDIEQDNNLSDRDELAAMKDCNYPWIIRIARKSFRYLRATIRTWWKELTICSKVDFSRMFGYSSIFVKIIYSLLLPRMGVWVSSNLILKIPGINDFLNIFTETPDQSIFLSNILGCGLVGLVKTMISFALNYVRYKQLQTIDVDEHSSDYARYTLDIYDDDNTNNNN